MRTVTLKPRRLWKPVAGLAAGALIFAACGSSGGAGAQAGSNSSGNSNGSAGNTGTASTSGAYMTYEPCCSWGSTWSFNPFSAYWWGPANYFSILPLANEVPPKIDTFKPALASSWSVSGNTLTLHLRPGAKWQNGTPVTSTDVVDTVLLDGTSGGTNGTNPWNGISDVSAPSKSTVAFTFRKGIPPALAETDVLPAMVYPSSEYGRFVTPSLKSDDVTYFKDLIAHPATAAKIPAYKAMGAVFSKLSKYSPSSVIGDGPFKEDAVTVSSAKMEKWDGYYGASKIHIAGINYLDGQTNQAIYPQLEGGEVAFSNVYLPPTIVKKWSSTTDAHTAIVPSFQFAIGWPTWKYPLNLTAVRQALAYVIPRQKMVSITYGTKEAGAIAEPHPDGLAPYTESLYLSKGQISQLNTYPVNLSKAASLLTSAGFHKAGGKWMMPNGKPFTLNAGVNSATSDVISDFEVMANALDSFGIKTNVTEVPGSETQSDFDKGTYDLNWIGAGSLDPLQAIDYYLGRTNNNNFPNLGSYAGQKGLGFGPVKDVPGIGTVNVPATIDNQAGSVGPGKKMDQLTWDWAKYINQQLPFLQWQNKQYQFEFSTQKFTNWPATTNPLWSTVGLNMSEGVAMMLEEGYVQPK